MVNHVRSSRLSAAIKVTDRTARYRKEKTRTTAASQFDLHGDV